MAEIKVYDGEPVLVDEWRIADVYQAAEDMGTTVTDEEAEDILYAVANNHDCNIGINWEVFYYHIGELEEERTEDELSDSSRED